MKTPFQSPQFVTVDELKGESIVDLQVIRDEEVVITTLNGQFRFFHDQDCCESVGLVTITGWPEVKESEVETAKEEITSGDGEYDEHWTESRYVLSTPVGTLDILFRGTSNGWYSESVTITRS